MKNKLFEVPETPILRTFKLGTYQGNRIAVKLMRLLKGDKIYSVKRLKSAGDLATFEISILSKEQKVDALKSLVNEVLSYIPDNFPRNYLFHVNEQPLGFVNSFYLELDGSYCYFAHKIKEINKFSIMPETQIFIRP